MNNSFGFIGFGEAASTLAREIKTRYPNSHIEAYDKFPNDAMKEKADKIGVNFFLSPDSMVKKCAVLGSFVTCSEVEAVAKQMAPLMAKGSIYIDFNSTTPAKKQTVNNVISENGSFMVDAAVMGSIPENGLKVSILLSGARAQEACDFLNELGFNSRKIGDVPGRASAIKMVRSVFAKGLEGLFIEMLLAAKRYDVSDIVIDSVASSLENKKIRDVMNTLVLSQVNHSLRKKSEMDCVMEVLQDVNINPVMSAASRDVFAWISTLDLKSKINTSDANFQDIIDIIDSIKKV